jgi:hypothetical protein
MLQKRTIYNSIYESLDEMLTRFERKLQMPNQELPEDVQDTIDIHVNAIVDQIYKVYMDSDVK